MIKLVAIDLDGTLLNGKKENYLIQEGFLKKLVGVRMKIIDIIKK